MLYILYVEVYIQIFHHFALKIILFFWNYRRDYENRENVCQKWKIERRNLSKNKPWSFWVLIDKKTLEKREKSREAEFLE